MFVNNAVAGDDPRLRQVYANYEANLRDIVRAASRAGAKTILCTVASNLRDCAPLLSVHGQGLAGRSSPRGRAPSPAGGPSGFSTRTGRPGPTCSRRRASIPITRKPPTCSGHLT
jgi:hypothetical protein